MKSQKVLQLFLMLILISSWGFAMAPVATATQAALFARVPQVTQQGLAQTLSIHDQLLPQSKESLYSAQQVKDWMEAEPVFEKKPWKDTSTFKNIVVPRQVFKVPSAGMFKVSRPMMMKWVHQESPHVILKVNENVVLDDLKKAYKKAAMESHPDVGGSEEKMKLVNEAYEFIKNTLEKGKLQDEVIEQEIPNPRDKAPQGNWTYVGTWQDAEIRHNLLGGHVYTWSRVLQDESGIRWLETAEFKDNVVVFANKRVILPNKRGFVYTLRVDKQYINDLLSKNVTDKDIKIIVKLIEMGELDRESLDHLFSKALNDNNIQGMIRLIKTVELSSSLIVEALQKALKDRNNDLVKELVAKDKVNQFYLNKVFDHAVQQNDTALVQDLLQTNKFGDDHIKDAFVMAVNNNDYDWIQELLTTGKIDSFYINKMFKTALQHNDTHLIQQLVQVGEIYEDYLNEAFALAIKSHNKSLIQELLSTEKIYEGYLNEAFDWAFGLGDKELIARLLQTRKIDSARMLKAKFYDPKLLGLIGVGGYGTYQGYRYATKSDQSGFEQDIGDYWEAQQYR